MNQNAIPETSHQVIYLFDLLKWVREGRLRIPAFQRDFVWTRQDILDLFDSIKHQYPIGSIVLWTSRTAHPGRDRIGPFSPPGRANYALVLDGQQRLTTLVGVLLADEPGWSAQGDEDPDRWRVYYDTADEQFLHLAPGVEPTPYMLPIKDLSDTVKMFALFQERRSYESASSWFDTQQVTLALQRYRISIIECKTEDLATAMDVSSRLNRRGHPMSQDS